MSSLLLLADVYGLYKFVLFACTYWLRKSLGQEVCVVEQEFQQRGQQDGQAEHDDVSVVCPTPGSQAHTVMPSLLNWILLNFFAVTN